MDRLYDVIVYGATGYTGKFAAAEAFRTRLGKKIAIAGRNQLKLEKVLDFIKEEVQESNDDDVYSQVGIVIADNSDDSSILNMCRQARVVVNCVGPYTLYGMQVVHACVQAGTHHVDISGEPQFLELCQLKYHKEAEAKGIHIVGTCGFDSIPADVGLETLRERFPGELTFAESFVHFGVNAGNINTGTYNSLIQAIVHDGETKEQNKLIFKEELNYTSPPVKQSIFAWSKSENKYIIPFMGSDTSVVKRTQLYESSVHGKTPIQYNAYMALPSPLFLIPMAIFGFFLAVLTKFQMGINLLQSFPGFFSLGLFSSTGPKREDLNNSFFKVVFYGKGYKEKSESAASSAPTNQSMSLTFEGPHAGYLFTSISLVAAANTLLDDQLLNKGGVLTPGSAFRSTRYLQRLQERGVKITTS